MSTHYLVNAFTDALDDVVTPQTVPAESVVTGHYVVRVPDEVTVREPTNLGDLLTKKYAGTLGTFGLFTQIAYDDMLDATGVNAGASTGVLLGSRGAVGLLPAGVMRTTATALTWGGPGAGPAQAIVTWEVFEYVDSDPANGVYVRSYREVPAGLGAVTVRVSFNGGSTFVATGDKSLVSLATAAQGSNLIVEFTHAGGSYGRLFLGSWAVLF